MLARLLFTCILVTSCGAYAAPNNNLYDRNRREANCDDGGCYPRRPPYYMPKGYVVNPEDEEDDEEIADLEPGLIQSK